ncbi:hypothetical protein A6C57_14730 [Fibrella sp. ES10-3-2-2]
MKEALLLLAVASCVACSRPPAIYNNPHGVTAMLNDSAWYGTVQAINAANFIDKPCAEGKVMLMIKTDIPYPGNESFSKSETVNGCVGECVPTQALYINNIPLKKGTYSLSKLAECGSFAIKDVVYAWLVNGSGLKRGFRLQPKKANWVRVTRYDPRENTLEGRFEANLIDFKLNSTESTGRAAQFRQGRFLVKLPKK